MIDTTDRKILGFLQENARIPAAEIARRIGMAPSAVHHRIRKLEASRVIQGYEARIDPAAADRDLTSFLHLQIAEGGNRDRTVEALLASPDVQELHSVVEDLSLLAKVRVRDPEALAEFLEGHIQPLVDMRSVRTMIVLSTEKESWTFPLDGGTP